MGLGMERAREGHAAFTVTNTYIDELRKTAKRNRRKVDADRAEADVQRCIKAYHDGYRTSRSSTQEDSTQKEWETHLDAKKHMTVSDGKAHTKNMLKLIVKLRREAEDLMRPGYSSDFLWFSGRLYEKLPDIRQELERRNAEMAKALEGTDEDIGNHATTGVDVVAEDLMGLLHMLARMEHRLEVVTKARAPKRGQVNNVRRFVLNLGEVYREHTGREPASGTHGDQDRGESPFVRFVKAVFECHVQEEAHRRLGDSIYHWLREDRRLREDYRDLVAFFDGR
jgi:hypothetical protein